MEPNENQAPSDVKSRPKNPRGRAKFWADEVKASQDFLRKFHKQGNRVTARFLDDRGVNGLDSDTTAIGPKQFRLNLFNSNVKTVQDMLYSNLPKVEASRAHADANDDVARVAATMIQRLINTDIADNGETYDSILKSTLQDRLLPGLGCARVRYEFETEQFEVPAQSDPAGNIITPAYTDERVVNEEAPIDYYYWQDVLWGWARNYSEIPWIGYRSYLSKDEVTERFGAEFAKLCTYKKQKASEGKDSDSRPEDDSPWQKAEVWEIWDKFEKQVVWYSPDVPKLLDRKADPLKLRTFFPSPPFMIANQTTQLYRPVSDYHLAQDLYNEIDVLQTRISIITTAVKVVGVYDASAEGIKRMLKEGFENDLIPVDNWAMFAEQGGIKGSVDWFPIEAVVNALDKLIQVRDQTIALLQQVTGMADVMGGALQNQYEGVGQTQIKAQFGSARIQALQDQFAGFAGDLLQLKAEVICKHFQPETIIEMSNMEFSFDAELLQPAVELLKQPEMAHIRIKVKPEQIAMIDYAKLKEERTDWLNAFSTFMQSAAPMLEAQPNSMPFLLQMLQWTMSGFKGSQEIEGVLDKAIESAQQAAQQAAENPQEDPEAAKMAAQQQADAQKLQGELQKIQAKAQADQQMRQADMQADINTTNAQTQAKMQEVFANHQANMAEIKAKGQVDIMLEQAQAQSNIAVNNSQVEGELVKNEEAAKLDMMKEMQKAGIEIDKETEKTRLAILQASTTTGNKMEELAAASMFKIAETDDDEDADE